MTDRLNLRESQRPARGRPWWAGAAILGALLALVLAVGTPATALAAIAFVQNLGTAQGQAVAALNIVTTTSSPREP
jgi:hypothetical protein